ncbi:phage tail sheath subtilisin-like domain-containing protein, partial [Myxococcota bacterium]|nr:phage tail sheath subtilisin-like domain-containing protein [Myxococcota bacterium]
IGAVLAARSSHVQAESVRTLSLVTTRGSRTDLSSAGTKSLNVITDDKSTAVVKLTVLGSATVNLKVTGTSAAADVLLTSGQTILADLKDVNLSTSAWAIVDALDELEEVSIEIGGWSQAGSATLSGGTDAGLTEYRDAIDALKEEGDVDMVLAAPQDFSKPDKIARIYSAVIAHSEVMAADSKGRVGFGQVAPNATSDQAGELAQSLVSDRFVLVSPSGCVGAVAGRVGGLSYFQSPTFKTISGVPKLSSALGIEAQQALLRSFVLPVVKERGRGVIVVKGITTDGDQINVRRVADRAVRGVKMIGDLFIGRLNTADGRAALKQKLAELLLQMEKDGALVPSTDGTDPAFKVDVYSSQSDFAQGIVRVDMAVRPVRAIDYIYATVLVQA